MARKKDLPAPTQKVLQTIKTGVKRGLTQKQIQTAIRKKTGTGIRDDFLRQGVRFVKGEDVINPPADPRFINKRTGVRQSPDPLRIKPSQGILTRKFSYKIGVKTFDEKGKKVTFGGVTVSSSTRLTKAQALAGAFQSVAREGLKNYTKEEILPDEFFFELDEIITSEDFLLDSEEEEEE